LLYSSGLRVSELVYLYSDNVDLHDVVQPIIVKKENATYRIVAGERRWRAARLAGLTSIPVIIKDISNKQIMEIALIENLQREDLNSIEEAEAYDRLMKEHNMTQEEISATVGKSRSAVANSLRLLNLDDKVKEYVISGLITGGHARALLSVEDSKLRMDILDRVVKEGLNVRDTEKLVKKYLSRKTKSKDAKDDVQYREIEERLKEVFGTKVKLVSGRNRGKIMIEYYSNDELDRILELVNFWDEKMTS
jgi:ParB family chromosome partitioning protein